MSIENLSELLNDSMNDFGVSVEYAIEKFFKPFNLGLLVFCPYGVLYKYQPEHRNKNIVPSALFMCVMNNHCYIINSDF